MPLEPETSTTTPAPSGSDTSTTTNTTPPPSGDDTTTESPCCVPDPKPFIGSPPTIPTFTTIEVKPLSQNIGIPPIYDALTISITTSTTSTTTTSTTTTSTTTTLSPSVQMYNKCVDSACNKLGF